MCTSRSGFYANEDFMNYAYFFVMRFYVLYDDRYLVILCSNNLKKLYNKLYFIIV